MPEDRRKRVTVVDFERVPSGADKPAQLDEIPQRPDPRTGKKSSSPLHGDTRKVIRGGPKNFGLPQINESDHGSHSCIVRYESPWDTYRRSISCVIAGNVILAAHRSSPSRVIAIRQHPKKDVDRMIEVYRHLNHERILSAKECFVDGGSMFALVDDLPLTFEHLVGCRTLYPTDSELASLLWQVRQSSNAIRERRINQRRPLMEPATLARRVGSTGH